MVGFFVGIIILSINGYVLLDIKEKLLTPKNLGAYEEIYTELVEATNLLVVRNTDCIEKTPRSDHSIINEIITSLTAGIYNVTDRTMEDVPVFAFDYILACADITKYTESNFNNIKTAGNFTLYKNSTPIKDIADFAQIYLFEKNTNYLQKSDFLLNKYGEGIDFYMPVATSTIPAYGLSLAYENIMPQNISDGKLTEIHKNTSPTTLYVNTSSADVYFRPTKNGFSIERGSSAQISVNGNIISPGPINPEILYQSQGDDLSNFIQIGSRLVIPDRASSTPIFLGTAESSIEILSAATSSVVQNGSFEDGLWSEQVSDCNNYDDNGKIAQRISSEVYSGVNSLELEATRHIACTGLSSVDVTEGQEYILSFAYQSPNAKQAGYYVGMRGATTTVITEKLPFTDTEWHTHHKRFTIPEGVKNLSLNLYSYATDNVTPIIVRYDDVVLKRVAVVRMIDPRREDRFVPTDLGSAETNTLTLADPIHNFKENINNGDFSKGFWNKTVGDCNNYDENGKLDMRLVDDERDGGKSLELEATRHTACTGPKMMPVTEGTLYLLSFDYQSENAKEAGYYIGWSGATSTTPVNERIPIKDVEWHTFTKQIKVPSGASSASLSVYTYEKDGKIPIKVRYDNFNFIELPDIANRYYLVSDPQTNFVEPQSVSFDLVNPTKKLVHIRGATTPFYLAMSESFHSQWQAQFSNEKVKGFLHSWVPWVKPDMISEENHFKLNGFLNGWYFDTQKYCEMENLCTKNPDGSYNVELVLEFFPQRWFYIGLLISGTTLVSCLGYLGYDSIRRRRKRRVVLRSSMRIQQAE
ncbi:MAG: hypothetical protein Q7S34_01435 [bacterium]|nr:hypothetical protein [bacterium]